MKTTKRNSLFERLQQGLEEGITQAKGELTLRTIEVPEKPPEIDASTLAEIRAQTSMSQAVFARLLSVSTKTLQSWEQGVRKPSEASRRFIQVFSTQPEFVCRSLGLQEVHLKGVEIETPSKGKRRLIIRKPKNKVRS